MLVTNGAAGVVQKYAYDAYGNNYEGSFAGSNNIGYNSKKYDGGTGWYDYGFRDYDSRTGRFPTVDPIRDGMNWYAYCGGDPINFIDFDGLIIMPIKTILKIADAEYQIIGATYDFVSQYNTMKEENIIGNDHYNHAMANSRATQRGKFGKATAQVLSFIREATDVIRKGDSDKDIREDNVANRYGRNIKPGENPEEYNAVFDTRQGGQRADLSNVASDESPKTIREFFNSFFTRDEYVNKQENNEEKNK